MRYTYISHLNSSKPTVSLDTILSILLKTRENLLNKIKEIDEQILNALRDTILETNVACLQIIITALASDLFNFENIILEFHYPTHPPPSNCA